MQGEECGEDGSDTALRVQGAGAAPGGAEPLPEDEPSDGPEGQEVQHKGEPGESGDPGEFDPQGEDPDLQALQGHPAAARDPPDQLHPLLLLHPLPPLQAAHQTHREQRRQELKYPSPHLDYRKYLRALKKYEPTIDQLASSLEEHLQCLLFYFSSLIELKRFYDVSSQTAEVPGVLGSSRTASLWR